MDYLFCFCFLVEATALHFCSASAQGYFLAFMKEGLLHASIKRIYEYTAQIYTTLTEINFVFYGAYIGVCILLASTWNWQLERAGSTLLADFVFSVYSRLLDVSRNSYPMYDIAMTTLFPNLLINILTNVSNLLLRTTSSQEVLELGQEAARIGCSNRFTRLPCLLNTFGRQQEAPR